MTKTTMDESKHKGISVQVVLDFTARGIIIEVIPIIIKILKILLPIILPKVKLEFFSIDENIFTTSSGEDVPNATSVKPMTIVGIFNFLAIEAEQSTKRFAPIINRTKPIPMIKRSIIYYSFFY